MNTHDLSPSEREEIYNAAVLEFEGSDKGSAARLQFEIQLWRAGITALVIQQELNDRGSR